jgi:hypothetical protein
MADIFETLLLSLLNEQINGPRLRAQIDSMIRQQTGGAYNRPSDDFGCVVNAMYDQYGDQFDGG